PRRIARRAVDVDDEGVLRISGIELSDKSAEQTFVLARGTEHAAFEGRRVHRVHLHARDPRGDSRARRSRLGGSSCRNRLGCSTGRVLSKQPTAPPQGKSAKEGTYADQADRPAGATEIRRARHSSCSSASRSSGPRNAE